MSQTIEFVGKSGARYRYMTLEEDRFLPPAGANYVITQRTAEGRTIVMAGETDNLATRAWRDQLDAARNLYGEVEVLTRLNVKSAIRREELADMLDEHLPPMNQPGDAKASARPEGDRAAS